MNQFIEICYKPDWYSDPNHWDICFELNNKYHREKAPSYLNSNGRWDWFIHDEWENEGSNFNWKNISKFAV